MAQRVSTQVTAFFAELENELRVVSKVQGLPKLDRDKQHSVLSELLLYQHVFEELVLLDSQGQERTRVSRSSLLSPNLGDRSQADEFVIPQTSAQVYYSPVRFEETRGEPSITIAVPLLDARTGLLDGVLVSEVRLKTIWNLIADIRVSPGQSVYLVGAQDSPGLPVRVWCWLFTQCVWGDKRLPSSLSKRGPRPWPWPSVRYTLP